MRRRWIIVVFILLIVSFLTWSQAGRGIAQDERFYQLKILNKLDKILQNQASILRELKGLKELKREK